MYPFTHIEKANDQIEQHSADASFSIGIICGMLSRLFNLFHEAGIVIPLQFMKLLQNAEKELRSGRVCLFSEGHNCKFPLI
jgi:hypothetical protein